MADDAQVANQDDVQDDQHDQQNQDDVGLSAAELQAAIKKLRTENASWRTKYRNNQTEAEQIRQRLKEYEDRDLANETDLKKKLDGIEKARAKEREELSGKLKAAEGRFIVSEAKRIAREAGMIDVDDVKVIDFSDLRVSDDNTVEGLEELIGKLKDQKPHWFKSDKTDAKDQHQDQQQRRTVVTPPRKDAADNGKDWKNASEDELRSFLRGEGVMI